MLPLFGFVVIADAFKRLADVFDSSKTPNGLHAALARPFGFMPLAHGIVEHFGHFPQSYIAFIVNEFVVGFDFRLGFFKGF